LLFLSSADILCEYLTCNDCLLDSACAWQVDTANYIENCRPRTAQTCPPAGIWYLNTCPCSGCDMSYISAISKTCSVLGQNYDIGYLCVLQSLTPSKRALNTNGDGSGYGGNNNGGSGHGDDNNGDNNNGGSGHGDNNNGGSGHGNDNNGDNNGGSGHGDNNNDNNGGSGHGNDNNGGSGHGNDNNGDNNGGSGHGDNNGGSGHGNHNKPTPKPTPRPTPRPTPTSPVTVQCLGTFLPVCCCIDDLDCDTESYCLYTTGGPSDSGTCVPWQTNGGICEENQNLHCFHQCAPDLECIHPLTGMPGHCGTSTPPPYGG